MFELRAYATNAPAGDPVVEIFTFSSLTLDIVAPSTLEKSPASADAEAILKPEIVKL